jgi:hypothetical protein
MFICFQWRITLRNCVCYSNQLRTLTTVTLPVQGTLVQDGAIEYLTTNLFIFHTIQSTQIWFLGTWKIVFMQHSFNMTSIFSNKFLKSNKYICIDSEAHVFFSLVAKLDTTYYLVTILAHFMF